MSNVITIDTTEEGSTDRPAYQPLEPGRYDLEITNRPEKTDSKNPSADGVNYGKVTVEFKEQESGKTLKEFLSLHPKMLWKLNQFAISCGIIEKGASMELDLDDLQGRVVTAIVEQVPWTKTDGTTQMVNNISEFLY